MDLSKYNVEKMAEQGAWLDLESPEDGTPLKTDDGKPVRIKLLGTDSKAWREKNRQNQRDRIAQMARRKSRDIDYTVSDEQACEMLSVCTIAWEGIVEEGETVEFSQEAAKDIYMRYIWIREQVDMFIGDRANFFPNA